MNEKETPTAELHFPEEINVVCGYGKSKITFYLRMISVAEENQYMQRFVKLSDDAETRAAEEYDIILEALCAWSTKTPTVKDEADKPQPIEAGTATEAIKKIFEKRTVATDRILRAVQFEYRAGMSPDANFF